MGYTKTTLRFITANVLWIIPRHNYSYIRKPKSLIIIMWMLCRQYLCIVFYCGHFSFSFLIFSVFIIWSWYSVANISAMKAGIIKLFCVLSPTPTVHTWLSTCGISLALLIITLNILGQKQIMGPNTQQFGLIHKFVVRVVSVQRIL